MKKRKRINPLTEWKKQKKEERKKENAPSLHPQSKPCQRMPGNKSRVQWYILVRHILARRAY